MSPGPGFLPAIVWLALLAAPAVAQEHRHPAPSEHAGHGSEAALTASREASGTAWLPDLTTMPGLHRTAGQWDLMLHGNAFAQFLYEGGEIHRRSHQAGSINWLMGMARRTVGSGHLGVRTMLSAEPWTIAGCGYPNLLATGETCDGDSIHDRQHPHDLFMELAVDYSRPLRDGVRWQVYGGLAGEPALGPPGFPHRLSASPNPAAPIGHHWLDASHITFGVVTAGIEARHWKVEASAFNGREPDEQRHDFDLAALDSLAFRLSLAPRASLALQVSAGRLSDAEAHGSLPRTDVTRATASVTYHRTADAAAAFSTRNAWATMVAWGMNVEAVDTTHAVLLESSYSRGGGHTLFGRLEVVGKPAHDLHVHESIDVFIVSKLQVGYTRYLAQRGGVEAGIGGMLSVSLVPGALAPRYGGRVTPGFGVFLALRPNT